MKCISWFLGVGLILFMVQMSWTQGQEIRVTSVQGTVACMTPDKKVQPVAVNSILNSRMVIRTGQGSTVQLSIGGQTLLIPPNTILPLERIANQTNIAAVSRFLNQQSRTITAYENSQIASVAGVRGENMAKLNASTDVMFGEDDIDSLALAAYEKARQYMGTNQADLTFTALEPFETYRGIYSVAIAKVLGNLLFERKAYDRASPLIEHVIKQPGRGVIEISDLRFKLIVCQIYTESNLTKPIVALESWMNSDAANVTELVPLALHIGIMANDLNGDQVKAKALFQTLITKYPDHSLTNVVKQTYPNWVR